MDIRRADVAAMFNLAAGAPLAGLSWRPGPTLETLRRRRAVLTGLAVISSRTSLASVAGAAGVAGVAAPDSPPSFPTGSEARARVKLQTTLTSHGGAE